MKGSKSDFHYRLLTQEDVGKIPLLHQGSAEEVLARIGRCGSSAMLAFEGDSHVGQLQFRPYVPDTRSPSGLWDPLYWMDFGGHAPQLPERTLALFCYHVGQLDDTDRRDPRYFGKGIGSRLLDETLAWAASSGFSSVVAKGLAPIEPLVQFMGGMPATVYESRGFLTAATYQDADLRSCLGEMLGGRYGDRWQRAFRAMIDGGAHLDEAAQVSVCLKMIM